MAYGDLTHFRASRAANCLLPEIGAPLQECVFDTWGHSKNLHSKHKCPSTTAPTCTNMGASEEMINNKTQESPIHNLPLSIQRAGPTSLYTCHSRA